MPERSFMDLNRLYFQHQLSLIRLAAATDAPSRARHRAATDGLAGRIALYRLGAGLPTANLCTGATA
jgi:hypothetical protein